MVENLGHVMQKTLNLMGAIATVFSHQRCLGNEVVLKKTNSVNSGSFVLPLNAKQRIELTELLTAAVVFWDH